MPRTSRAIPASSSAPQFGGLRRCERSPARPHHAASKAPGRRLPLTSLRSTAAASPDPAAPATLVPTRYANGRRQTLGGRFTRTDRACPDSRVLGRRPDRMGHHGRVPLVPPERADTVSSRCAPSATPIARASPRTQPQVPVESEPRHSASEPNGPRLDHNLPAGVGLAATRVTSGHRWSVRRPRGPARSAVPNSDRADHRPLRHLPRL